MNDSNIELITFRDIPYSIEHIFREIKHKSEYFNQQGKFYRKVFSYISTGNIEYIATGKNFIKVIYHISDTKRLIFKSENTDEKSNYNNLCGYLYTEYEDEAINEIVISKPISVSVSMKITLKLWGDH